ncbi:MAG: DNA repair and recombination protein RadA [Thaumarchaeota archaeon]|nr:DNA repair and recombination protein RadA [Nitrososphaerota archaeon]
MAQSVLDLTLKDLDGVGPATEKKLREAGVESIIDLAAALPEEVAQIIGGSRESACALIYVAQTALMKSGLLEKEFIRASEVFDRRKALMRCTTGSKNLDELLKGGVETQAITELWGEYGSGKTQICHTLCITCQLPLEKGGLGGSALYIDTESTFRPERLYQIAEARGLNPQEALNNVVFCRVYNSSHLELVVKSLGRHIEKDNIRLLVVDSVISLYRAEFSGRGSLAERQQRLNSLLHRLLRIAEIYNVAVVVTNQVQAQPDTFFGDPNKPAGGHVIAHASTYRIYLKKAGQERRAILVDSPYHPHSEATFTINEKGVVDPEPKKKTSD